MKKILSALFLSSFLVAPAFAGTGTIQVKDQGGTVRTFDVVTDGSGNFIQTSTICDGAAAAQCAAVKAASTPAAATDPALVVVVSPNNSVAITGAITANAGTNLNTSALALDTSINGILLSQGSTTSGQKGPIVQGAVTTNAPSYTTAQTNPLSLDPSGLLRISLKDTPSNTNNFNVNLAASGVTLGANITQFGGAAVVTGTGAGGAGIPRVTVSNDSAVIAAGNVASASADSGNPLKIGCVAHTALPTAGADGNRFDCMADKFGRQVFVANADRALVSTAQLTLTSTTETTLLAAVASTFLDLVHLSCNNTSATLVRVDIRDATAGTVRISRSLAANGGGFVDDFNTPWPQTTVNNNWTAQLSGAVTDVRCDVQAVKNK